MHILWTSSDLNAALGQDIPAGIEAPRLCFDSRQVKEGEVFVALKGPKHDGHDHVAPALAAGAVAALVERPIDGISSDQLILVPDVLKALEKLAVFARERSSALFIGVTGSFGKTSTKEALARVFAASGPTHATERSLNNHWGVPMTLVNMPRDARYAVLELGMNHAGELEHLSQLVKPHIAFITTVGGAHMQHFGSVDAIAKAKAEIFKGLVEEGIAVINQDDTSVFPILEAAAKVQKARIVSFGRSESAAVQLLEARTGQEGLSMEVKAGDQLVGVTAPVFGQHWAQNLTGVLAVAQAAELDLKQAAAALQTMTPLAGRGQQHVVDLPSGGQICVIDESYNASPPSMRAALSVLGSLTPSAGGRRIAALGDMLELGPEEKSLHEDFVQVLQDNNVALVFTSGPKMRWLYEVLPVDMRGGHDDDPVQLAEHVRAAVRAGDIIMVKGSRGAWQQQGRMHKVVAALLHMNVSPIDVGLRRDLG